MQGHQPQGMGQGGGGLARTIRYARGAASGAVAIVAVVAVLDWTMPYHAKPSVMLGVFAGRHDEAELDTARRAQAQTTNQVAIAQAAPPAAYQQETIVLQHQQGTVASALAAQSFAANTADLACMLGRLWSDPGRDWREVRDAMRDLGCGLGDDLRANMSDQLAQAARRSAIVPRTAAPDPARMPQAAPPAAPRQSPVAPPAQQARWVQCPSFGDMPPAWDRDGVARQACRSEAVWRSGVAWLECEVRPGNRAHLVQEACSRLRRLG